MAEEKKEVKKAPVKKAAPKKEAVKKAAPKKEAVKKAAPKKEAVKKAAPKKEAVKKAAPKKKTVTVTLLKSFNGRLPSHRATVTGLGLKRINHTVELIDTPEVRGMINKVSYLLKVEG
jgi:large subunit ribosomal protein L30